MKSKTFWTAAALIILIAMSTPQRSASGQVLPEPTIDEGFEESTGTAERSLLSEPEALPGNPGPALTMTGPAYLGVTFDPAFRNAAVVLSVHPGSPAAQAGLQAGDIIETLNGQTINSNRDVLDIVATMRAGEVLDIDYSRRMIARTQAALEGRPSQQRRSVGYPPNAETGSFGTRQSMQPTFQQPLPAPPAVRAPARERSQYNPNYSNQSPNRSYNGAPNNGRSNANSNRQRTDNDNRFPAECGAGDGNSR